MTGRPPSGADQPRSRAHRLGTFLLTSLVIAVIWAGLMIGLKTLIGDEVILANCARTSIGMGLGITWTIRWMPREIARVRARQRS